VEYIGALLALAFIRLVPKMGLRPMAWFAGLFLRATPKFRKLVMANLRVAFPEREESELRRIMIENATLTPLTVLELFWFSTHPKALDTLIDFPDEYVELTNRMGGTGRGAMWMVSHFGNWELAGLKFEQQSDFPLAVVVRPLNNTRLNKLLSSGRSSQGTRVISAKGAVRGIMKALKDGFFVATLIDQNTRARDGGVFVDFFGLPAPISRAPAMFARKVGASVAVGGALRTGKRYMLFVRELPKPVAEYSSDEELLRAMMAIYEDLIREHPEQYLWFYEKWRHIPEWLEEKRKAKYPYYSSVVTPRFYSEKAPKEPKKK
jgi:KDO2-lipid IV(A) lauroyltransferase